MTVTVEKLLARGDEVCIQGGRLVIRPSSGKSVPRDWQDEHSPALLREILLTLGMDAYEYDGYSTGLYGPHKAGGVTIQFPSFVDGKSTHAIFNADLDRERTTKAGAKGSPLPKGHFRISPRSHLFQLWQSTGLSTPKSLSSLHDYLGNLRGILFVADPVAGRKNRLDTGTLRPLFITTAEVRKAFQPDNGRITTGQVTDNCRIRMPDKDFAPAQKNQAFQPKPSACTENRVKALISTNVYTATTESVHSRKPPEEQTDEEWLAAYCSETEENAY